MEAELQKAAVGLLTAQLNWSQWLRMWYTAAKELRADDFSVAMC